MPFIAVNPAINIIGLLKLKTWLVFSLLWRCLDIRHCFRRESESLLGIKSKLWQWELSYWEWPCRRGCLQGEQFPRISHCRPSGVAVLPEPAVCLVSKESEFPHTPPVPSNRCRELHSARLLAHFQQTHRLKHSRAYFWPWWLFPPPLPSPPADFTRSGLCKIWLYQCGGNWSFRKCGMGGGGCSACYRNSDIMSSAQSSIDHTAR